MTRTTDRKDTRPVGDDAAASNNHPADRQTCLRVPCQRRIAHLLLHFKPARFLLRTARNRFVDVGCHGPIPQHFDPYPAPYQAGRNTRHRISCRVFQFRSSDGPPSRHSSPHAKHSYRRRHRRGDEANPPNRSRSGRLRPAIPNGNDNATFSGAQTRIRRNLQESTGVPQESRLPTCESSRSPPPAARRHRPPGSSTSRRTGRRLEGRQPR